MHSKKKQYREMPTSRQKPIQGLRPFHGLLAAAVAALVVMPVAFAGAADGPVATTSAASKLVKQVKSLKRRVAALEARQTGAGTKTTTTTTTGTPSGPAGGDLTGTFPNPTIGDGKVTGAKVATDTLTAANLAPDSVGASELATDSVGSGEFRSVTAVVGAAIPVAANSSNSGFVNCPAGMKLIAGGYAWQNDVAGTSIIASAPDELYTNTRWDVTGRATAANTLYPWATCLAA